MGRTNRIFRVCALGVLACLAILLLIGLGDWLRNDLGDRRGNVVLTLGLLANVALAIAAFSPRAGRGRLSAVAAAAAVAIECGVAGWLVHPDTQLSIAMDRVNDVQSGIDYVRMEMGTDDGARGPEAERIIGGYQRELVARKLEEQAAWLRFRTNGRSSLETVLWTVLGVGVLAAALGMPDLVRSK